MKGIHLNIVAAVCVFAATALSAESPERPDGTHERILHFPTEYCIGKLLIQDADYQRQLENTYWANEGPWKYMGPAMGDVVIPANKRVELIVYSHAWENPERLDALKNLQPDDIYYLIVSSKSSLGKPPTDNCITYLRHLSGAKVLSIRGARITKAGLRQLAEVMTSLKQIYMPDRVTNGGLAEIVKIKTLEAVYLGDNLLTNPALQLFARLPELKELAISGRGLSDEGLAHLSKAEKLEYLYLTPPFTNEGLKYLKDIPSLKILYLQMENTITDEGIRYVSEIKTLETLSAYWEQKITDKGAGYLKALPRLKSIHIQRSGMGDAGLKELSQITTFEEIELPSVGITDRGISYLSNLKNLRYLRVGASSKSAFTDAALETIGRLEKLESLDIAGVNFTDAGLEHIAKLKNLRNVSIFSCPDITDAGLVRISRLENLERLYLPIQSKITFAGLNSLAGLKKLTHLDCHYVVRGSAKLDISGMKNLEQLQIHIAYKHNKDRASDYLSSFEDADLACLAGLSKLTSLTLIGPGITDEGLRNISSLKNLDFIYLAGVSDITDEAIGHLKDLDKLWMIEINKGHFSDKTLDYLADIDGLENVRLTSDTAFSKEAIEKFKTKKKNLQSLKLMP